MTEAPPDTLERRTPWWQAGLVFVLIATLYAAVSIQQYRRMDSFTFDLGFFESLIRDYAHGRFPSLPLTDTTNAGLHFSPALAVLAPLVLVWPSPIAVLLAQAVLVAFGVVPLMRAAPAGWTAWVVALSYGLAPGFGALIGFDFHEVALAVPLISLSMAAMLREDHRAAVLWSLPLILVKEDLGLTVAALGAVVFLRGSRRWGLFAMVFGTFSFLVLMVWVLPAIQSGGSFADKYAPSSVGEAWRILTTGVEQKVRTVLFWLIPTGLLAARSPMLLLVAVPTFGWRFLSDRVTYWDPWYQYDAVLVPIVVAAMIEGARLMPGWPRRIGLATAVCGTLLLVPKFAFSQVWAVDFWRTPERTAVVDQLLDKIPSGSRVAASDVLGGRIALRTDLHVMGDTLPMPGEPLPASDFDEVEWVAFDSQSFLAQTPAWQGFGRLLDSGDFRVVAAADGVVVAERIRD